MRICYSIRVHILCAGLEAEVSISDNGDQAVLIQTQSDAQLIQILQHHDFDDDITRMVEAEIARRKKEGGAQ